MGKLPAFQFYPGDWLTDPQLSLCTPAARGVWIDLLCAIHKLNCDGELRGTAEQLARVTRCLPEQFAEALTELQATGTADVSERNGVFTILSRRMMRDSKTREQWRLRKNRQRHSNDVPHMSNDSPGVSSSSSSSSSSERPPNPPAGRATGEENGGDVLDSEIRTYIGGHRMLTWDRTTHAKCRKLVESAGWVEAKRLIDLAVSKGVNFPVGWALTAWGNGKNGEAPKRPRKSITKTIIRGEV